MDDSGTVQRTDAGDANGVYFAAVQSELADEVGLFKDLLYTCGANHCIQNVYLLTGPAAVVAS
jgi:hypothetical protein